jgi:cytochrome c
MDRHLIGSRPMVAALLVAAGLAAALPATAAGDAAKGKSVFGAQCAMCHSAARGGPTILGPTLFGVVGRPAGSVKGFAYSSGMKSSGITWSPDKLRAYLPAPAKMVPGTKMSFGGLKNPIQVDDVVAYLETLK